MIESIVGVEYDAELVRVLDSESCEQLVTTGYGASLVIEDGEHFSPPSEEFLTLVRQWLMSHPNAQRFYSNMLTKALSLILVMFLGLALGLETARYVHAQATGVGGAMLIGTGGTSGTSMVNIHRALLGFSLLATSGALLLSLRRHGLGVGAWLSRKWLRFTTRLELTLDGLFDFDALNVGDGASALSTSTRGLRLMTLYKQGFGEASLSELRQEMDAIHRHPDGSLDWRASNAAIIKQTERRLAGWEPRHGMHLMKLYNQRFGQGSASTVRQEMDAKHRTPEGRLDWRAANAALFNDQSHRLALVASIVGCRARPIARQPRCRRQTDHFRSN
jgi:hypothetical protein